MIKTIVATPLWSKCEDETHIPKSGNLESSRTPKNSELDCRGKKTRIEMFFVPLERSWSLEVQNGLGWAIWRSAAQVMVERKVGSQIDSLTLDHLKSGIDPIPVCAGEVRHTLGKLSRRAKSLLQTSSQSKVWTGSYELPKSWESKLK
jgi:hypothetical protein